MLQKCRHAGLEAWKKKAAMQVRLSFGAMQSEEPPCVSTCLYIGVEADHKAPLCLPCLLESHGPARGLWLNISPALGPVASHMQIWDSIVAPATHLSTHPHLSRAPSNKPSCACPCCCLSDARQTVTCCPQNPVAPHLHLSWLPNIRKVVITSGPSRLVVLSAVAPRVVLWAAALAASSSPCWPTVWAAAIAARCHAACTAVGVDGSQHLGGTPAHLKSVHTAGA